jgi:hypothetical protein
MTQRYVICKYLYTSEDACGERPPEIEDLPPPKEDLTKESAYVIVREKVGRHV